jgi:hypothetical protein
MCCDGPIRIARLALNYHHDSQTARLQFTGSGHTFRGKLMKATRHVRFVFLGLALLLHGGFSVAQQDGKGGCIQVARGQVYCSPPNGGIMQESTGRVVCGPGQCVQLSRGRIVCSSQPGGYARIIAVGHAACTGECQQASVSACQRLQ